jgi:hypothetical protein
MTGEFNAACNGPTSLRNRKALVDVGASGNARVSLLLEARQKKLRMACCPNSTRVPKHIQRTGTMPWGFSAVDRKVETNQCNEFYFFAKQRC